MLAWLADQANVLYFLLGAAVLGLLAAGWMTRRTKFWGYAAGAAGLMLLVWLLTKLVVTDRQQIALNLESMKEATLQKKPDVLFQHISKDFRFGTMSRDDLYQRIRGAVQSHKVDNVDLWDKQVTVKGDAGEAFFNFKAFAEGGGSFPASAKAKFVREEGRWKLSELQIFKFGTTERQFLPGIE